LRTVDWSEIDVGVAKRLGSKDERYRKGVGSSTRGQESK